MLCSEAQSSGNIVTCICSVEKPSNVCGTYTTMKCLKKSVARRKRDIFFPVIETVPYKMSVRILNLAYLSYL